MNEATDERLQRLLGGENLATLRRRLRRRFEHAASSDDPSGFRLGKLTAEEHRALAALLGRPPHFTNSLYIDVEALSAALRRAGIAVSLRDALERLDGPLVHRATARHRLQLLWAKVVAGCRHPALLQFLTMPAGLGLLKRLANRNTDAATVLCSRAEAVLRCLPATGIARAQLAADALGDAHALDGSQATATLVLAVWRQVVAPTKQDLEDASAQSMDDIAARRKVNSERSRDVWARAGVLVNELARPVLFLNLPIAGAQNSAQARGEPEYLSLRSLLRSPRQWAVAGRNVYVCENANLLAIAADRLGSRCAPFVCTDGMPAAAQRRLLTQLAQAGAHLNYHGDFDWPGIRIANHVMREYGAGPWRFGAEDYMAAIALAPRPGHLLKGPEVRATWDDSLYAAMRSQQIAIAEEAVAAALLPDLEK
jgi:uncharacterized protein (TIGR02679 family)